MEAKGKELKEGERSMKRRRRRETSIDLFFASSSFRVPPLFALLLTFPIPRSRASMPALPSQTKRNRAKTHNSRSTASRRTTSG